MKIFSFLLLIILFHPIEAFTQLEIGSEAPKLIIEEVVNKEKVKIHDFKDKIVVLDFWAIWCTPCVESIPDLNDIYEKSKNSIVQFISISDDPIEKLKNFLSFKEVKYPVVVDSDASEFKKFKVSSRPRYYILNRKGIVVYTGNSISRDLIEMAIRSDSIAINDKQRQTSNFKDNHQRIVTNGGFSPGDDPIVTGMKIMLGESNVTGKKKISQFIIRPSLEKAFSGHGYRTKSEFVGVTYSGGKIAEILQFLNDIPSSLRIEDKSSDTNRYDIIYWKKSKSIEHAFKEILEELLDGLNLKMDSLEKEQNVNLLVLENELNSTSVISLKDIPDGAKTVFIEVGKYAHKLEKISDGIFLIDDELKNKFIPGDDLTINKLHSATKEEIENHLMKYGIVIRQEIKKIKIYIVKPTNLE